MGSHQRVIGVRLKVDTRTEGSGRVNPDVKGRSEGGRRKGSGEDRGEIKGERGTRVDTMLKDYSTVWRDTKENDEENETPVKSNRCATKRSLEGDYKVLHLLHGVKVTEVTCR